MALLVCPECQKEVSEFSEKCLNCGCPIDKIKDFALLQDETKLVCKVNERLFDITWIRDELLSLDTDKFNYIKFYCSPEMDGPKAQGKHINDKYFIVAGGFNKKVYNYLDLTPKPARYFLYQLIDSNFTLKEFNGETLSGFINKQNVIQASQPKCPICGSTNICKISGTKKAASIIGFGILSNKIGRQWHCNHCKSDF